MLSKQVKVLKTYEPFILGTCLCPCSTAIDIFSPKSKGRRVGYLRRFLNSAHALKARNQTGKNNSQWKGAPLRQDKDGYWLIHSPDHPNRNNDNKVFAHRLIYEHYLSILFDEQVYLPEGSEIHHINEDKEDNSLINLKYMDTRKDHKQEHLVDMDRVCRTCGTNETSIRSDSNKRSKWYGSLKDGWQCSSCNKKEYYLKNKKEISEIRKERWLKNKDEINKRKRELYRLNKNK